jgi:hypothetical protein
LELDERTLHQSQIPWAARQTIGAWRAYWRTVAMSLRRPGSLGREATRPVSFEHAKRFQVVTARILSFTGVAVLVTLYGLSLKDGRVFAGDTLHRVGIAFEVLGLGAACWSTSLFFRASTLAPVYFFRAGYLSDEQRQRATAVGLYGCGGLSLLPLLSAASGLAIWRVSEAGSTLVREPLLSFAVAVVVLSPGILLLWNWVGYAFLLRGATRCGVVRMAVLALAMPALWGALAAIILAGIPAAVAYVALFVMSLMS